MQPIDAPELDVLREPEVTWMDIYILYSVLIGTVAILTGAFDLNALVAVWGIWTVCAIAYFARDRRTWSPKCDAAVIVLALPIAAVPSGRSAIQLAACIQIVIHHERMPVVEQFQEAIH